MNKYLYLFRGADEHMSELSNEEQQAHMQRWGVWMKRLGEAGNFVDGLPLSMEGKLVKQKGEIVTNGPYAEGKEVVGGYLIVNARDLDHAAELARECPIFENEGEVEVRPIMGMDMHD